MQQTISKATRLLRDLAGLGVSLIVVGVVIDILFPDTTGIATGIANLAGNVSEKGLAGLIALLLFVVIYGREQRHVSD
ncbi:MAG: hypothetical protein QF903_15770 [Planctomycetota bacterium]|jgi:hypothetical protein|nr:hypothetical protein [Planctomycetota bacterium]MDP6763654.1 hypothetical protein [Planctomycetota bacterium]MDP6990927.1 hypothetical protein [Planctomycetota bacterium]